MLVKMNRWKKSKNGEYFLVILGDRREERRMKKNEGRKEKRKAKGRWLVILRDRKEARRRIGK